MRFYQKCLGGKLTFQTVGKTSGVHRLPQQAKKYIVQATLRKNGLVLIGTDMVCDAGLLTGNSVSLLLRCPTPTETEKVYKRLSRKGHATQPLTPNYFGILIGCVTDQYGFSWILTT
jgi:PhnB protein